MEIKLISNISKPILHDRKYIEKMRGKKWVIKTEAKSVHVCIYSNTLSQVECNTRSVF